MAVLDLAHLTWEEVRDLDRTKTVAIVPVGAVEAHGPHLPLATDVIIAEAMARAAAGRLAARGHEAVLLPAIAYTAAEFAAGFPGTVSLQPATVTALLVDLARSLARHGLSLLAVANAHLDPAHLGAIEAAVTQIRRADGARIVFPDVTKKPWAVRLTEEFRSGACHAGQYESSTAMNKSSPMITATINPSIASNSFHPTCVMSGATSAAMPRGANNSTQCTMRISASVAASAMLVSGARFSTVRDAAATAKIVMNTSTGRRLPSAAALKGLAGTGCTMNAAAGGMLLAAC